MNTDPSSDVSELPSVPPEQQDAPGASQTQAMASSTPPGLAVGRRAGTRLVDAARGKVSAIEHLQMRIIRRSLEPGPIDVGLRFLQRTVGVFWITQATRSLHQVHHIERLRPLFPRQSFILVANHRSFFDLYVVTAALLRWGLRQRIVFPVRSNFFYDSPAGFVVNGAMSFFAMYPPLFRDKRRSVLNVHGLSELAGLLQRGETLVGIHPEGRRNPGQDPYELLPAQSGVGRLIHAARGVPVVPVFTNGLLPNNLPRQIMSNFDGTGTRIHSVFGAPIDFGGLRDEPASPRLFSRLAEKCLEQVQLLGHEEKALRAAEAARP